MDIEKSKQYTIKNYPLFKQEHLFGEDSESIVLTMTTFLTNERLEAQSGRFTVGTNPLANHNDFMDMACNNQSGYTERSKNRYLA